MSVEAEKEAAATAAVEIAFAAEAVGPRPSESRWAPPTTIVATATAARPGTRPATGAAARARRPVMRSKTVAPRMGTMVNQEMAVPTPSATAFP